MPSGQTFRGTDQPRGAHIMRAAVIAFSPNQEVGRRLALLWGVAAHHQHVGAKIARRGRGRAGGVFLPAWVLSLVSD